MLECMMNAREIVFVNERRRVCKGSVCVCVCARVRLKMMNRENGRRPNWYETFDIATVSTGYPISISCYAINCFIYVLDTKIQKFTIGESEVLEEVMKLC